MAMAEPRFEALVSTVARLTVSGCHCNIEADTDKRNCLLLSRLACNGKMLHPSKGYSGPLSRHLLAYQCLVSVIRSSLRDLIEMSLAVLFLEADAERIREDFLEIADMCELPIASPISVLFSANRLQAPIPGRLFGRSRNPDQDVPRRAWRS